MLLIWVSLFRLVGCCLVMLCRVLLWKIMKVGMFCLWVSLVCRLCSVLNRVRFCGSIDRLVCCVLCLCLLLLLVGLWCMLIWWWLVSMLWLVLVRCRLLWFLLFIFSRLVVISWWNMLC